MDKNTYGTVIDHVYVSSSLGTQLIDCKRHFAVRRLMRTQAAGLQVMLIMFLSVQTF